MKKFGVLITLICIYTSAYSQVLSQVHTFTHADSLRGTLTPLRTCYDVYYYDLTLKTDIENKFINGDNKIFFTAMNDFNNMQIDLFSNLTIDKIVCNGMSLNYTREFNAVFITMDAKQKKGTKNMIDVYFSGNPTVAKNPPWDGGFTFVKDDQGKDWVSVSCEGIGASVWWPNKDHLSDEPDSMMIRGICRQDLSLVANGNLRKKYEPQDGYKEFDWFVSYPINNYDVSISIGNYVHFGDIYTSADGEKLDLDYYVLAYNLDKAKKQFQQVKPMMSCYEKYLGKYPFYKDGYALIETPYLGMEHQSGIAYGNKYLTGYAGYDYSQIGLPFDYIIIHESGHEWWGNNVSMKDVADMWIHEGFCTYSESLYVECMYDYATAMKYIDAMRNYVRGDEPIIGNYDVNSEGSGDMYHKGALFLNTLRHVINNDTVWFGILKGIQKDFAYQTVTTAQIEKYISDKSGIDLSKEFDQYLRYKNAPILFFSTEQKGADTKLSYRWITDVKNFDMPIKYKNDKDVWTWLYPTNVLQTDVIKNVNAADITFDTTEFYYWDYDAERDKGK